MRPPAPNYFHPAGDISWAILTEQPPFIDRNEKRTGRRRLGQRYEKDVSAYFSNLYGADYIPGPWFKFRPRNTNRDRWCQCDGIIRDHSAGRLIIIEAKYSHTFDAWYQLFELYKPVVEKAIGGNNWTICGLEVVKWFDPSVYCEPPAKLCERPEHAQVDQFSVMIYSP